MLSYEWQIILRNWEKLSLDRLIHFILNVWSDCSLQSSSIFLQVKFLSWEDAKKGGQGIVNVWFSAVDPLGFKTWDPQISFLTLSTKWPWAHFKISFWNIVFQTIMFYFKVKIHHLKSKHFLKNTCSTSSCDKNMCAKQTGSCSHYSSSKCSATSTIYLST